LSPQIKQFLSQSKREQALSLLAKELEKKRDVVYLLEPLRATVGAEGSPARGPADAPVTVVEFSDFECSFCRTVIETLDRVQESYGDQVRIVFRQFPLDMHPAAGKAAEAALCAHDQDKFWPMHDLLFNEQNRLDVASLKEKAGRLGLNQRAFNRCLDSGQYGEKVQQDLRDGKLVGVRGTPALFVNGIPVPGGAVPYETLSALIDEELERLSSE
jgi:protein-disulfide isomerase